VKLIRSSTVEDSLDQGIFPKKLRKVPNGIPTVVWRRGHNIGNGVDLAWLRGEHSGLYSAYLTIRKKYPEIAEEFRKAVGFNKDGAF
jgi:hypothetical protein